jgi:hypothetical protein
MPDRLLAVLLAAPLVLVAACAGGGHDGASKSSVSSSPPSETTSPSPSATKTRSLNAACQKPSAADAKAITDALTKGSATDGYAVKSTVTKRLTFISFYVDGATPARTGRAIGTWASTNGKIYNASTYTRTLTPGLRYIGKVKTLKGSLGDKAARVSSGCSQQSHGA